MPNQRQQLDFQEAFKTIKQDLRECLQSLGTPQEGLDWYEKSIDYNLRNGKLVRGLTVLEVSEIIKGRPLTRDECFQAAALGWCIEMLQAYFLVIDDIADGSTTRRGRPCWYHLVGTIALNDACMLKSAIFVLTKKYFRKEKYYVDLLHLIWDTIYKTESGQVLDTITGASQDSERYDLSKFSLDKYRCIIKYKTAYWSICLPVAMAMLVSGIPRSQHASASTDPYAVAAEILLPLGEYFQIQDDYLDSYAPESLGKVGPGTDIVDGKCSWCVCVALSLGTQAQKDVLSKHYGKGKVGEEDERRVKEVYDELGLPEVYRAYEEDVRVKTRALIERVGEGLGLKKEIFTLCLDKIYSRSRQTS